MTRAQRNRTPIAIVGLAATPSVGDGPTDSTLVGPHKKPGAKKSRNSWPGSPADPKHKKTDLSESAGFPFAAASSAPQGCFGLAPPAIKFAV